MTDKDAAGGPQCLGPGLCRSLRPELGSRSYKKKSLSHHQSFVHEELLPRSAVVVLGVDGKAEEEDVHHDLEDGQEAVSHQEGEETHDDQRQQPLGVIPLVVQEQDASKRRRRHNQDLGRRRVRCLNTSLTSFPTNSRSA